MDDGADVGFAGAAGWAQRIAVQGIVVSDGFHTCGPGDGFDRLGIIGVLGEQGFGAGCFDLFRGLVDVFRGGVLLVVEVAEGGTNELHVVGISEVAEGIVGGEEHPVFFRHAGNGVPDPLVQEGELGLVFFDSGLNAIGSGGIVLLGFLQGGTDVKHLDVGLLHVGPHVGVVGEFGLFTGRDKRPRPDIYFLVAEFNGVAVALLFGHP